MKRVLLTAVVITSLTIGALLANPAQAQGPQRRFIAVGPQVVVVNGGYAASSAYGGYGYGNGGYANGGFGNGGYGGYVAPYYLPSAPYGAGYSGGYQPYQQMYLQRLYYGLGY